jgi:hypothetical protein
MSYVALVTDRYDEMVRFCSGIVPMLVACGSIWEASGSRSWTISGSGNP